MDDNALDFDKAELDAVFEKASPYLVAVLVQGQYEAAAGILLWMTTEYCVIAAISDHLEDCELAGVRYSNNHVSVDIRKEVVGGMTLIYAKRDNGEPNVPQIRYSKDGNPSLHEKVVSFFPYEGGIAMFNGYVMLGDSKSPEPTSVSYFAFTCPYGYSDATDSDSDSRREKTLLMTQGAPVFDLGGTLLGILTECGLTFDIKFAMPAYLLIELIEEEVQLKWEDNEQDEEEQEDEDEDEDEEEEEDDQPHKKTHRLAAVNMDWDHIKWEDNEQDEDEDEEEEEEEDDQAHNKTHRLAAVNMDWDYIKKQKILQRHVSSSCSSNIPCQLTRHCQSCPANMSYGGDHPQLQLSLGQVAQSDTVSGASTEGTNKDRETHDWTHEETDHLFGKLDTPDKLSMYLVAKSDFSRTASIEMNTRFRPQVKFTKDTIRTRLAVVRKQWNRKRKGLPVSRPVSQSVPLSLLDKYSQTIAALDAAQTESSSSVQLGETDQDEMTVEDIVKKLISWGIHGKIVCRFRKALVKNKEAARMFHLYPDPPAQLKFLKEISSKGKPTLTVAPSYRS